jgi:hypothetical protein
MAGFTVWDTETVPLSCTASPRGHDLVLLPAEALAGQRPPDGGAWLLVVACQEPDGEFTVRLLPRPLPHAHGGDVLVKVSTHERQSGPEMVHAQVVAVAGGRLVLVARWETPELVTWPDRVRPAVAFAVSALDWLEARGADTGTDTAASLDVADNEFVRSLPWAPPVRRIPVRI